MPTFCAQDASEASDDDDDDDAALGRLTLFTRTGLKVIALTDTKGRRPERHNNDDEREGHNDDKEDRTTGGRQEDDRSEAREARVEKFLTNPGHEGP